MNKHLTYLTLKYGTNCTIGTLYEIPAEIVFEAYRNYYNKLRGYHTELSDDDIIKQLSPLMTDTAKHILDTKLIPPFSTELEKEIKNFYE